MAGAGLPPLPRRGERVFSVAAAAPAAAAPEGAAPTGTAAGPGTGPPAPPVPADAAALVGAAANSAPEAELATLVRAAGYGSLVSLRSLLAARGGREAREALVRRADGAGHTALHFAAKNGHVEALRVLLDNGARVDAACFQDGMQVRAIAPCL